MCNMRHFIFILVLFTSMVPRAYSEPEVETLVEGEEFVVGDTFKYHVKVSWERAEANYSFTFPDFKLTFLEILKVGESQESYLTNNSNWTRKTFTYTLHTTSPGEGIIHSYELSYIDPATQKGGRFRVSEQSVLIKNQSFLVKNWKTLLVYLGLFVLIFAMWQRISYSKRKKKRLLDAGEDKEYESIMRWEGFIRGGSEVNKISHLSDMGKLFRQFIWEYYNIPKSLTSEAEIMNRLKEKTVSLTERDLLASLLNRLSEANFMGESISENEIKDLSRDLNRFVEGKKIIRSS